MHENKFEKEVRGKMDHFGLDPSEAVWAGVEKEINKDKKDRRPLFWLFFFSGLVLLGGGIYTAGYKNSTNRNVVTLEKQGVEKTPGKQSGTGAFNKADNLKMKDPGKGPGNVPAGQIMNQSNHNDGDFAKNNRKKEIILKPENDTYGQNNAPEIKSEESKHPEVKSTEVGNIGQTESADKKITAPGLATIGIAKGGSFQKDSASEGKISGKENKQSKKPSWAIGFSGSAGVSNVNQALFKPTTTTTYFNAPGFNGSWNCKRRNKPDIANSGGFFFWGWRICQQGSFETDFIARRTRLSLLFNKNKYRKSGKRSCVFIFG